MRSDVACYNQAMRIPTSVLCERCGADAAVLLVLGPDSHGRWIRTPKTAMRPGGLCLAINCPKCGESEQRITMPPDIAIAEAS